MSFENKMRKEGKEMGVPRGGSGASLFNQPRALFSDRGLTDTSHTRLETETVQSTPSIKSYLFCGYKDIEIFNKFC